MEALDQNTPARAVQLNEDEQVLVKGLQLLTMKPLIYAANVSEGDLADQGASNKYVKALRDKACQEGCEVIIVSAQVSHPAHLHRVSLSSLNHVVVLMRLYTIMQGRLACKLANRKS